MIKIVSLTLAILFKKVIYSLNKNIIKNYFGAMISRII